MAVPTVFPRAFGLLALSGACGHLPPEAAADRESASVAPAVAPARAPATPDGFARASNAFALDLWRALPNEGPKNRVVAPASAAMALSLVAAGARGETAEQLLRLLHVRGEDLDAHIASAGAQREVWSEPSEGYRLSVASRVFGDQDIALRPEFLALARDAFGGDLQQLELRLQPDASRHTINAWVAEQTKDRITDLLPPGSIHGRTALVTVDTVWLDARWGTPFEPAATAPAPFHTPGGEVEATMMNGLAMGSFAELDDVRVLELPYQGDHLAIDIVMGRSASPVELSDGSLGRWVAALKPTAVQVSLPRFELAQACELNQALASLGATLPFDEERADFSGIVEDEAVVNKGNLEGVSSKERLVLDAVHQSTWVRVDEAGTEAAASTAATYQLSGAASGGPDAVWFVVDRPFLFLIRDLRSGAVLFLGEVADPTTASTDGEGC